MSSCTRVSQALNVKCNSAMQLIPENLSELLFSLWNKKWAPAIKVPLGIRDYDDDGCNGYRTSIENETLFASGIGRKES